MIKRPLIIDTDPGIDDAVALAIACHSTAFDIKLITTVSGNVGIQQVTENTQKLLKFWHKKIPVAQGASSPLMRQPIFAQEVHGVTGLDGYDFPVIDSNECVQLNAIDAIRQVIMTSEELVTLVAMGPLTNIALLLKVYPEVKVKIKELVIMGGALGRGNVAILSEFNIMVDPEAAQIVFDSYLPIVLVPLDVGLNALVKNKDAKRIATFNRTGNMLVQLFHHYQDGDLTNGVHMYDSCTIAYLLKPELFQVVDAFVAIETKGEWTTGATIIDYDGKLGKSNNCQVCLDINSHGFTEWLEDSLKSCD